MPFVCVGFTSSILDRRLFPEDVVHLFLFARARSLLRSQRPYRRISIVSFSDWRGELFFSSSRFLSLRFVILCQLLCMVGSWLYGFFNLACRTMLWRAKYKVGLVITEYGPIFFWRRRWTNSTQILDTRKYKMCDRKCIDVLNKSQLSRQFCTYWQYYAYCWYWFFYYIVLLSCVSIVLTASRVKFSFSKCRTFQNLPWRG